MDNLASSDTSFRNKRRIAKNNQRLAEENAIDFRQESQETFRCRAYKAVIVGKIKKSCHGFSDWPWVLQIFMKLSLV